MVMYYFITEEAKTYKGTAIYEKYIVPKGLSKDLIKKIFIELKKKVPTLLGLFYDPEKGKLIVWYAKVKSYFPWALIVAGLLGVIGGGALWSKLTEKGEGQWNPNNPPGLGLSMWDLIKLGMLAFVVYMFAKTFTDVFLAVKEKKPMPTPWEVYVAPAMPYIERAVPYVVGGVKAVAPYVVKGVKKVVETVKK